MGSPEVERHLNFRDYLIAHPEEAKNYSRLKRELAQIFPEDIESYTDGKQAFIGKIDTRAKAWRSSMQTRVISCHILC
jgi:GrpB-like predicted nucleotidyltransferase (UPF0157 family)